LPRTENPEKLYQTGTLAGCFKGTAEYGAFEQTFQEIGDAQAGTPIKKSVKPGDVMTASVDVHGDQVRYLITDLRNGKAIWFSDNAWSVSNPMFHSGECIVEAPPISSSGKATVDPLPNFGTAKFFGCQVSDGSGQQWSPTSASLPSGWDSIQLSMKPANQIVADTSENPLSVFWRAPTTSPTAHSPATTTTVAKKPHALTSDQVCSLLPQGAISQALGFSLPSTYSSSPMGEDDLLYPTSVSCSWSSDAFPASADYVSGAPVTLSLVFPVSPHTASSGCALITPGFGSPDPSSQQLAPAGGCIINFGGSAGEGYGVVGPADGGDMTLEVGTPNATPQIVASLWNQAAEHL